MDTATRLAEVEAALTAKRATVKGFCERYKDCPGLLTRYRRDVRNELRVLAKERALLRKISKLDHDLRNSQAVNLLARDLAAKAQPEQPGAEKWHDTEVLDRVRTVCEILGLSPSKPDESITLAWAEKNEQIKALQQDLGQATVAKELAEKTCFELAENSVQASAELSGRVSDLKIDLVFANERATKAGEERDALMRKLMDVSEMDDGAKEIRLLLDDAGATEQKGLKAKIEWLINQRDEKAMMADMVAVKPDDPVTLAYLRAYIAHENTTISELEQDAYSLLIEVGKPWCKRGNVWQTVVMRLQNTKVGPVPLELDRKPDKKTDSAEPKIKPVNFKKQKAPKGIGA
jgi:hypothetical protein